MSDCDDKSTISDDFSTGQQIVASVQPQVALVIYHRDGVKVVPMEDGEPLVVGRAWPSDVVVPDLSLSRQHARLTWTKEGLLVEDLGSTNGTRARGERVERARVAPGETVNVGSVAVSANVARHAHLKGIESHEGFMRRLEEEVLRARTFRRPLALLMLRAISTEQGHVSKWVPRIRGELREVDQMSLYGLGSALVLLTETDQGTATQQARNLVRTGHLAEPPLVCGIAMFPQAGTSHELLDAVRQAARSATQSKAVWVAQAEDEGGRDKHSVVIASEKTREVFDLVHKLAASSIPVLIWGETGTGKEVVARGLHKAGPRTNKPMRSINCGAIPANLIESVLFGHEKGAFTGAEQSAAGIFEQADGGTVLLDEVGELSPAAQAALLRVLETKQVTRVGGTEEKAVDVRVVAATHRDLEKMVEDGQFRLDLLYRLNPMKLSIPALRDRTEEIEPLAELFLGEASRANGASISGIHDDARRLLRTYSWPGNVRELRNEIERAVVICRGEIIQVDDLSERVRGTSQALPSESKLTGMPPAITDDVDFKERVRQYEVDMILGALKRCEGNQTQAAKMLRMPLRTLVHKIKAYGIRKLYDI